MIFADIPTIVTSAQDNQVISGHSITMRCGQPNQNVLWYKSNVAFNTTGQELTIHQVSSKDEGTYHCVVDHGPKVSMKVLVIGRYLKA